MRLPFLTKQYKPTNKFLVADINSQSVKCLAFYVDEQKTAKIIGVGNMPIEQGTVRTGNIVDFDHIRSALENAVNIATQDFEEDIRDIIFGVNGDLAVGLMTTAKAHLGRHAPIQQEDIISIEQTIFENAQVAARNEILETTGNSDTDIELVTAATVYSKVNNRLVQNPISTEGESIELAKFTAFTPSYHVQTLQRLAKKLKLNIIAIGAEMYSLVSALNNGPDYIIIDMESDFTEVAVIFGGGIVATKCLHIGSNHFTKEISQKMGITLAEAEKMKNSYAYNKLAQSESGVVQSSIHDTLDIWLDGIQLLFTEFSGVKTFASKIYLLGEGSKIPDVHEFIGKEPWTRSIPFRAPPEFYKVKLEDLTRIVDSTGEADVAEYIVPASLSVIYLEMFND